MSESDSKSERKKLSKHNSKLSFFIPFTIVTVAVLIIYGVGVYKRKSLEVIFTIHGNTDIVLSGMVVPKEMKEVRDMYFGLGSGSNDPNDIEDYGEGIVLANKFYVKSIRSPYEIKIEDHIKTPYFMGLSKNYEPHEVLVIEQKEGEEHKSFQEVYENLSKKYPHFAAFAYGDFINVATMGNKRAPIYGEPIFTKENRAKYLNPMVEIERVSGFTFGTAINLNYKESIGDDLFSKMFYYNPTDKNAAVAKVSSHTHMATLEDSRFLKTPNINVNYLVESLTREKVIGVYHLLSNTKIEKAIFLIYLINGGIESL